jgi:hypothetical protein
MGAERWICSSCGATTYPLPEPPPGCARCDAPLQVGKYGLIDLLAPEHGLRIYRGRESTGARQVTVRILPENLLPSVPALRETLNRFTSFSHAAIAPPLDAGAHRGRPYVVEDFAPGEAIIRVDLTLRESMGIMRDVANAVEAAHEHGIIHPDLRADHVRLYRGAGKALGDSGWRVRVTGFVGPGDSSVRSNVQAIGAILYTVAMGRPPGAIPAPNLNPLVDTALESIIRLALDADGSHQPPGAGEIATELTRWLKEDAPAPRKPSRIVPPANPAPRRAFDLSRIRPEARIAAGISLALLVVILLLSLRRGGPAPTQARRTEPMPQATPVVRAQPDPPKPVSDNPGPPPKSVARKPSVAPEPNLAPVEKPSLRPQPKTALVEKPVPPLELKPAPVEKTTPPPEPKPTVREKPAPPPDPKPAPVEKPAPPLERTPPLVEKPTPLPEPKPTPIEKPAPLEKPAPPPDPKPAPVEKPAPPLERTPPLVEKPTPLPGPKPTLVEKPAPPPDPKSAAVEKPTPPAERKPPLVEKPAPAPEPKRPPVEPPKPPTSKPKQPTATAAGVIQAIHPDYGIFVKLEVEKAPAVDDELEAIRDGKVVARLVVELVTAPEKRYPRGCAVCRIMSGAPSAGDGVQRVAK